jgi:hypothetical protein
MSESLAILSRITALRDRLIRNRENEAQSPTSLVGAGASKPHEADAVEKLETRVKAGTELDGLLDAVLRQLPADTPLVRLPSQLTSRAHRLLEVGKDLHQRLRKLGEQLPDVRSPADPMAARYESTVAMTDFALRAIATFPGAPSVQLRLCDGIGPTLDFIRNNLDRLSLLVERRRKEEEWIAIVLQAARAFENDAPVEFDSISHVAEAILCEHRDGAPLRFLHCDTQNAERMLACHQLNVAQVMARVIRNDPVLSRRPVEPVAAALLQDVGMLDVPPETWQHAGVLDDAQRQRIESHTRLGSEWAARHMPDKPWLAEAIGDHHERLDGTGYPGGLRANQISWLPRLLAVCDVYTALCSPRPHRAERNTRTALTDTFLMAEDGKLDRHAAERLLALSLYPAGTVVELADGSVGVVLSAAHPVGEMKAASRPVIALLADYQGKCLPLPTHLDLAAADGRSIVRSLSLAERRKLLSADYPEFI